MKVGGTHKGGIKAAAKNKELYGEDFYKKIGRTGGLISTGGGFKVMDPEKVREAARKGGFASKRKPKLVDSQYEEIKLAAEKRKRKWLIF